MPPSNGGLRLKVQVEKTLEAFWAMGMAVNDAVNSSEPPHGSFLPFGKTP